MFFIYLCYDLAVVQNKDTVADSLYLLQYMGGEYDCLFLADVAYQLADLYNLVRVKTCGRLIQDKDIW